MNLLILFPLFLLCTVSGVVSDGQRDYGEPCSLRSQIANLFRENDSAEGCMSERGLVCVSHKCTCDPTSIYAQATPSSSGSEASDSSGGVRSTIGNFLLKKFTGDSGTTTTAPPPQPSAVVSSPTSGGRCLGRSGSPCLSDKSACVEHATCQGSPKLCRCQGIYSSGPSGLCSKRATVANEVLKRIAPGFGGRKWKFPTFTGTLSYSLLNLISI